MEMRNGPEQLITETYMIPGSASNLHLTSTPPLEDIGYMSSEVAPDLVFDQGLYYPAAANYFGYYSAGFESPGEWNDHHRFYSVDGQDVHYPGLQTESLPYVYYTPSYGYAQSPYNPYNPYIPGAAVGLDAPLVGAQQYPTDPSYQQPVSSAAYFPIAVQSGSGVLPISSSNPSLLGSGASINRPSTVGTNSIPLPAPSSSAAISQWVPSGNPISEPSQSSAHQSHNLVKGSGRPFVNAMPVKQHSSRVMARGGVSLVAQGRNSSGATQETEHFTCVRDSSVKNPLKVSVPVSTFEKFKPRFQYNGAFNRLNGSPDLLGEQNRGPRTANKSKGPSVSAIDVRAFSTKAGSVNAQGNITICLDQYNRDDFPVDYPDAKFFIIKSYSEDDVHKSIKYSVWSSTPNGNKRLDGAYEEAQRISVGKPRKCPVFLFFSVNASGQFCGVAEMIGRVDFNKDMDFWQQDKWSGSFPVKWHIVKDVPNTWFRHIVLENNENKPVTNSRDTQEILYLPGMNMLSIFTNSTVRTSILDDFIYYEERQRIMYEEKCRLQGRNYDTSMVDRKVLPFKRLLSSGEQRPNAEEAVNHPVEEKSSKSDKEQLNGKVVRPQTADSTQVIINQQMIHQTVTADEGFPCGRVDQPSRADGKHSNVRVDQALKTDGKQPNIRGDLPSCNDEQQPVPAIKRHLKADGKKENGTVNQASKADGRYPRDVEDQPAKVDGNPTKISHPKTVKVGSSEKEGNQSVRVTNSSNVRKDSRPDRVEGVYGGSSVVNISSLSIDSKIGESNCLAAEMDDGLTVDVVTVGSVHIKVKKSGESSGILTIGAIPIDPKADIVRK